MISNQKAGKQVLNPGKGAAATLAYDVEPAHDAVAVVGTNRKMLVFPQSELPEMSKGRGVKLQHYSKGDMADAKTKLMEEGLTWARGQKTRTFTEYEEALAQGLQRGACRPFGLHQEWLVWRLIAHIWLISCFF